MPKSLIGSLLLALILSGLSLLCIVLISLNFSGTITQTENDLIELRKKVNDLENKTDAIYQQLEELEKPSDEDTASVEPVVPSKPKANEETPTPTESQKEKEQPVNEKSAEKLATVTATQLNMRDKASTKSRTIRVLPQDEPLVIIGEEKKEDGFNWVHVKDSKGNEGWVVKNYIKLK